MQPQGCSFCSRLLCTVIMRHLSQVTSFLVLWLLETARRTLHNVHGPHQQVSLPQATLILSVSSYGPQELTAQDAGPRSDPSAHGYSLCDLGKLCLAKKPKQNIAARHCLEENIETNNHSGTSWSVYKITHPGTSVTISCLICYLTFPNSMT